MPKKKKTFTITPSVASANQLYLADELFSFPRNLPLHVDIEDGNESFNITFGLRTVMSVAEAFENPIDYHIIATRPSQYYKELAKTNARFVFVPFEALRYPMMDLDMIRDLGMKPALALDIHTSVEVLRVFTDAVDAVLLLTYGSPRGGMNGLGFQEISLERIRRVREIMPPDVAIVVDGGIGIQELQLCADAGANAAVLGRLLFPEEVSEASGRRRILPPKDRSRQPNELLAELMCRLNSTEEDR